MTTYAEYQEQIAALQHQAEVARKAEIQDAKVKIEQIMSAHGLTLSDLGSLAKQQPKRGHGAVPPKYRDPATGLEWTGRGRAPLWLTGKDKADYLIK